MESKNERCKCFKMFGIVVDIAGIAVTVISIIVTIISIRQSATKDKQQRSSRPRSKDN